MNRGKFEVYFSKADDYRWRLKAGNGEIVAVSEGYKTKQGAKNSALRVREIAPSSDVIDLV